FELVASLEQRENPDKLVSMVKSRLFSQQSYFP
ncbi:uncharacterized protein METZ01_LOCUS373135, partial [marine metagenome]